MCSRRGRSHRTRTRGAFHPALVDADDPLTIRASLPRGQDPFRRPAPDVHTRTAGHRRASLGFETKVCCVLCLPPPPPCRSGAQSRLTGGRRVVGLLGNLVCPLVRILGDALEPVLRRERFEPAPDRPGDRPTVSVDGGRGSGDRAHGRLSLARPGVARRRRSYSSPASSPARGVLGAGASRRCAAATPGWGGFGVAGRRVPSAIAR